MRENGNLKKAEVVIQNLFNSKNVSGLLRSRTIPLCATSKVAVNYAIFPQLKTSLNHIHFNYVSNEK